VIPDAGFVVRAGKPDEGTSQNASFATMLNFVELDNGTMPPSRVLQKLEQYAAWSASEAGERYLQHAYAVHGATMPNSGFRLLIVVHDKLKPHGDQRRLVALFEQVLELPAAMRDRVWLATAADLKAYQHHPTPLSAEIWVRGRDAKGWIATRENNSEQEANTSRRQLVAAQLDVLLRHPLFPRRVNLSPLPCPA
jgi:hypothetical protein